MSRVDQFESIFRSATKEVYQYQDIGMEKLLVVTDKTQTESEQFSSISKIFLHALTAKHELSWELLNGDDFTHGFRQVAIVMPIGKSGIQRFKHL